MRLSSSARVGRSGRHRCLQTVRMRKERGRCDANDVGPALRPALAATALNAVPGRQWAASGRCRPLPWQRATPTDRPRRRKGSRTIPCRPARVRHPARSVAQTDPHTSDNGVQALARVRSAHVPRPAATVGTSHCDNPQPAAPHTRRGRSSPSVIPVRRFGRGAGEAGHPMLSRTQCPAFSPNRQAPPAITLRRTGTAPRPPIERLSRTVTGVLPVRMRSRVLHHA